MTLNIEGAKETATRTWSYPDGMKGYLDELLADAQPVAPVFDGEKYVQDGNGFAVGEGAAWAFAFVDEAKGVITSYSIHYTKLYEHAPSHEECFLASPVPWD